MKAKTLNLGLIKVSAKIYENNFSPIKLNMDELNMGENNRFEQIAAEVVN